VGRVGPDRRHIAQFNAFEILATPVRVIFSGKPQGALGLGKEYDAGTKRQEVLKIALACALPNNTWLMSEASAVVIELLLFTSAAMRL
jgi:hypothetical protein